MKIIIDGYNVLKQAMRSAQVSQQEKDSFLLLLDRYARLKKHEIVVVFDGGEGGIATKEYVGELLILYSGHKESADDLIVRLLEKLHNVEILLISTDRELRQKAARLSVDSLPALDFYERVEDTEHGAASKKNPGASQTVKISRSKNTELDDLMMHTTQVPKKDEYAQASGTQSKKKLPKAERAMVKKVKKL